MGGLLKEEEEDDALRGTEEEGEEWEVLVQSERGFLLRVRTRLLGSASIVR